MDYFYDGDYYNYTWYRDILVHVSTYRLYSSANTDTTDVMTPERRRDEHYVSDIYSSTRHEANCKFGARVTYNLFHSNIQLSSQVQSHMAFQSNHVYGMCTLSVIMKSTLYKRRTAHSNTVVNWTDALDLPQVTRGSEVCCHHQCKRWDVNKLIMYNNKFKNSGIIYIFSHCLSAYT